MSLNIPREEKRDAVIKTFRARRSVKAAAEYAGVPYGTAQRWLRDEKMLHVDDRTKSLGGPSRNASKGPDATNLPRVDRDPCPKCNVRKDIGCKHFPNLAEARRPMTDRERAEAMWSKQV